MFHVAVEKTHTTKAALAKSPQNRLCYTKDETTLKHFDMYSQSNYITDKYINVVYEKCGCIGRSRGKPTFYNFLLFKVKIMVYSI